MRTTYFLLIAAIYLASCTTDAVNVEVPNTAPKISVSCFISDDIDTISARISWSDPVFSTVERPLYPDDMDVRISNGVTEGILTFDNQSGLYELPVSSFSLQAGQSYSLKVRASDGTEVSASTYIPILSPSVFSHAVSLTAQNQQGGFEGANYLLNIKTTLNDASSAFEYYRLNHYIRYQDEVQGIDFNAYYGSSFISDDALNNGKLFSEFNADFYDYSLNEEAITCVTLVMNATEEYYRFHQTLNNQSPGDPFSEPTLVYSNVAGGLGVFAGYKLARVESSTQ